MVVVLSAMGKYTDELISMAEDINENHQKRNGYALYDWRTDVCISDGNGI